MYTLLEINKLCPEVLEKCEVSLSDLSFPAPRLIDFRTQVYIDGGIRRGTDVVKALCLGAKGVGMGRPFLYSLTYGREGVVHAIESKRDDASTRGILICRLVMRDEIATTMRLLAVNRIDQLGPHLVRS